MGFAESLSALFPCFMACFACIWLLRRIIQCLCLPLIVLEACAAVVSVPRSSYCCRALPAHGSVPHRADEGDVSLSHVCLPCLRRLSCLP